MPPALRSAVWPWRVAASPVSCPAQQQHDRWRRPPARHRAAAPCPPARLPEKPSPLQRPLPAPLAACSALLCSALLCSALVTPCRLGGTHATPTGAPALQPLLHGAWACTGIAARLQRWLLCGVRLSQAREAHGLGHVVVHRCAWLLARDMLSCACLVHLAFCSFLARLV